MEHLLVLAQLIGNGDDMSFKIKAHVNAAKNIVVQDKNTGVSVTTLDGTVYNTNSAGELNVPVADTDYTNDNLRNFPLSQYGDPYDTSLGIVSSGFTLSFNKDIPLFLNGLYFLIPPSSINLNINNDAQNKKINIYVKLRLGFPEYFFSFNDEPETNVNMFIGTVNTNSSSITSININHVSRFGVYRPSTSNIGAAFPVSTGHPTQSGTINW